LIFFAFNAVGNHGINRIVGILAKDNFYAFFAGHGCGSAVINSIFLKLLKHPIVADGYAFATKSRLFTLKVSGIQNKKLALLLRGVGKFLP